MQGDDDYMHIQEFQKMMQRLYFHRDSERGLKGTFNWLMEEVEELREALEKGDRKEVEREFDDVIAWLSSLANIVGVDLEKAALAKYQNRCPKCRKTPCACTF